VADEGDATYCRWRLGTGGATGTVRHQGNRKGGFGHVAVQKHRGGNRLKLIPIIALIAAAAVSLVAWSQTASAALSSDVIHLNCGADGSFDAIDYGNQGNSTWAPAHILGTNRVIKPVEFSNFVLTVTDESGTHTSEPDGAAKAHAPANADLMSCHFTTGGTFPGGSYEVSGDVVAFVAGK
jgi:hypothetical protein